MLFTSVALTTGRAASTTGRLAQITRPAMSAVVSEPVEFEWTKGTDAEAYQLWIGSAWGGKDLYDSGETQVTTLTVPGLPHGMVLFARVKTRIAGVWYSQNCVFTVAGASLSSAPRSTTPSAESQVSQIPAESALARPAPPESAPTVAVLPSTFVEPGPDGLIAPTKRFAWRAVPAAECYYLWIGSSSGTKDIFESGETLATDVQVARLPANRRLFCRINTKIQGQWKYVDQTAILIEAAKLTQPADGGALENDYTFKWDGAENALGYKLSLGTTAGASDILRERNVTGTSLQYEKLPENRWVYARLETNVDGTWHAQDSKFMAIKKAVLLKPEADDTLGPDNQFSWNPVAGAERYYLWLGRTLGGKDLYESGEISATSIVAPALPRGVTLYARLHTKVAGTWYYVDSHFTCPP